MNFKYICKYTELKRFFFKKNTKMLHDFTTIHDDSPNHLTAKDHEG